MKFLRKVSVIKKKPELQISTKTLWNNQNIKVYLINAVLLNTSCIAIKISGPDNKLNQVASLYYKAFKFLYPKIDLIFYSYTSSTPKFFIIIPNFHQVPEPKAHSIASPKALKFFFKSLIRFYYIPLPISLSQELYTCNSYFIQIPKIQDCKIVSEEFLIKSMEYCSFSTNIKSFSELRNYVYSLYNKQIHVPSRLGTQDLIGYCKENFNLALADTGSILALDVNKEGSLIATGGLDGFVRVWDIDKNQELCNVKNHSRAVHHLKFSGNSQLLLSGGNDKNLCFFTLGKKKRLFKRKAHEHYMNCLSISPDDRLGITGGDDGIVQLWDLGDHCILSSLKGHISSWRELPNVITSDISQFHNIGITGGSDGYVRIWRLEWRTLEGSLTSHSSLVPYIPSKNFPFLTDFDSEDRFYENVTCVKFLKNSKLFASGGEDGFIMIWDLLMKEKVAEFGVHRSGRFDGVKVLAIAANDSVMASGGVDGKVGLLNLDVFKCEQVFDVHFREGGVTGICFSPDDKLIITAGTDSSIGIINIKQKALETYINCHVNKIVGVRFLDVEKIISFGLDGFAKIWTLSEMKCVFQLQGHKGLITALIINPFIEEVITGGFSGYIKFWKIKSKKMKDEKAAHKGWVSFLALGPSGQFFVSGGSDGVLKMWDSVTRVVINKTQCGSSALIDILVANNGEGVIAASQDNKLYFWDTEMNAVEVDRFSKFVEIKRRFKEFHKFIDYIN